jgi:VWFA-related protein
MPRLLLPLFFLAASCNPIYAQSASPEASGVTLHAGTRLVVVDVVVTDRNKNPVHNLKASDFRLLEDNTTQKIQHFDEHTGGAVGAEPEAAPAMPPGYFTNYSPVPAGSSINILLLDTLNTPVTDQEYVKDQIRKFLKDAKPGAPIAIFGLTTRLSLLQSFTADPELLKAAINKKNNAFSALLDNPVTGGPVEKLSDDFAVFAASSLSPQAATANLPAIHFVQQGEALQAVDKGKLRAQYTLDAINQLGRYLAGMPGRKNLIWFSGSFPIDIMPGGPVNAPAGSFDSLEHEFRETANLLAKGQVAVYPIDARGALISQVGDVSQSGAKYDHDLTAFAQDQLGFHEQTMSENSTMLRMAEETGGKAFLANNDLAGAVTQAIATGSNYYTLAYTPSDPHWNGGFRQIRVKLEQQGVTLAYRRGYFADDPAAPSKSGHPITAVMTVPEQAGNPMHLAMMRGAPDPSQITLKVRVLPNGDKAEAKPVKGNTVSASSRSKGPYRSYAVDIAADPQAVSFTKAADGVYHSYLQFLTYVYDEDGRLINSVDNVVRANLPPAAYARVLAGGVPFRQEVSVPVKGDYTLRIGLHDLTGNRVGAVEVPVATVRNLPPVPALTATAGELTK